MKTVFITIDGKQFDDEDLAKQHEEQVQEKLINPRLKILEQQAVFKNFKEGDIISAGRNFDGAGNSQGYDKIQGAKDKIMLHLAINHKYWNIGNQLELHKWENDIIQL